MRYEFHDNSSWNRNCFLLKKKRQSSTCRQVVYSNFSTLGMYANSAVPAVHLAVFQLNYGKVENWSAILRMRLAPEQDSTRPVASWASVITKYRKRGRVYESLGKSFVVGEGERVKITPGEWILWVTRPSSKGCENLVPNTGFAIFSKKDSNVETLTRTVKIPW